MTKVELSPGDEGPLVEETQSGGEKQDDRRGGVDRRRPRGWVSNLAVGALAAWITMALYYAWLRWGKFDPVEGSSQARENVGIQLSPAEFPWYYPTLLLHVIAASVALATCVLQVWPWLRRRHPRVHRYVGRVYVFVGVYPAVVTALLVEAFWPFSLVTSVSQVVLSVIWGAVTTCGVVARWQGRIEDHRRWMLRSFVLTLSVLLEIAIHPYVDQFLRLQLDTRLAGSEDILAQVVASTENWLCLLFVIIAVEWWLERRPNPVGDDRLLVAAHRRSSAKPRESTVDV